VQNPWLHLVGLLHLFQSTVATTETTMLGEQLVLVQSLVILVGVQLVMVGSSLAQMPDFVSAMNTNLRILMKRSFREINADYKATAIGVTMAERVGRSSSHQFL